MEIFTVRYGSVKSQRHKKASSSKYSPALEHLKQLGNKVDDEEMLAVKKVLSKILIIMPVEDLEVLSPCIRHIHHALRLQLTVNHLRHKKYHR